MTPDHESRLQAGSPETCDCAIPKAGEAVPSRCLTCWGTIPEARDQEPPAADALDASLEGEWTGRGNARTEARQQARTDGWTSDRIPNVMAQEQRDIREAVTRCRNIDDERTIYKGNINRLVGERERLREHLLDLYRWATNYRHGDPEVVAMLDAIAEELGEDAEPVQQEGLRANATPGTGKPDIGLRQQDDLQAPEFAHVIEHGTTPEAEAVRVLRRAMCMPYGRNLVLHGLLRPFGMDPAAHVAAGRARALRIVHETWDCDCMYVGQPNFIECGRCETTRKLTEGE